MARPGTTISRSEARSARSSRTSTGPWFVSGTTGTADTLGSAGVRTPCRNLTEYATRFGARSAHVNDGGGGAACLYDSADTYFKESGAELFVSPATYHATPATFETNIATALALFTDDLGPGQVSVPGRSTAATHAALLAHGELTNRVAILDAPNTSVVGTLTAAATIAGATVSQERFSGLFAGWSTVAGVTPATTRTIPPSPIVAGIIARNDAAGVVQNQPSAGHYGVSQEALSVTPSLTDAEYATLNTNGVNMLRMVQGDVRVYGFRTLADPTSDPNWLLLSNARVIMAIQAIVDAVAERFVFRQIDGKGLTIAEYGGALTGAILPFYLKGALYGDTPAGAFNVNVGPTVNTPSTIAAGQLKAVISLKVSPYAEEVVIELVKTNITETL